VSTWKFGSGLLNVFQSHTARVSGHELQSIYRMRRCLEWETVVVFGCAVVSNFFPFLLPFLTLEISVAEWIFSMAYCSLPLVRNWKYAAYRGTSRVPAVDDDTGKGDTAIGCGMTLDGDWWQARGSDFQASRMTANRHLRYNKISRVGRRKTSGNGKQASNSCPDPHEKYTAAVSDLDPLQQS
jgi:hypothetical protein